MEIDSEFSHFQDDNSQTAKHLNSRFERQCNGSSLDANKDISSGKDRKEMKVYLAVGSIAVIFAVFLVFGCFAQQISSVQNLDYVHPPSEPIKNIRILEEDQPTLNSPQPQTTLKEEDSQKFLEYSKVNQRKADRIRRQKRIKKELQDNNILKDIKKNPYLDDEYSYISKADLMRVKKWRFIVGQDPVRPSVLTDEERQYYREKYNIDKYEELPFCLVIPTFNNKPRKRAERNIRSVIMQQYKNFHFIVIDDGSVDGTSKIINNYLEAQTLVDPSRYKVETRTQRTFSLANIRYAAKNFCNPKDIMIVIDGDDQLLGRQVLKLFNAVFQQKGIWYMYTNFLGSIGKVGYSRPYHPDIIEKNQYRDYSFAVSHLRAYYTQLLLNIKEEDLQDQNGKYFTSAGDMAIAIPCLEMSHRRIAYVPEMTYFYNFNTGLNVHKKRINEQRANNLKIRQKKRYQPLQRLFDQ